MPVPHPLLSFNAALPCAPADEVTLLLLRASQTPGRSDAPPPALPSAWPPAPPGLLVLFWYHQPAATRGIFPARRCILSAARQFALSVGRFAYRKASSECRCKSSPPAPTAKNFANEHRGVAVALTMAVHSNFPCLRWQHPQEPVPRQRRPRAPRETTSRTCNRARPLNTPPAPALSAAGFDQLPSLGTGP